MCRDRRRAAPPALLPAAPIRPALELPTPLGRRPPPTATDGVPIDRGDERALPDSPAPHSPLPAFPTSDSPTQRELGRLPAHAPGCAGRRRAHRAGRTCPRTLGRSPAPSCRSARVFPERDPAACDTAASDGPDRICAACARCGPPAARARRARRTAARDRAPHRFRRHRRRLAGCRRVSGAARTTCPPPCPPCARRWRRPDSARRDPRAPPARRRSCPCLHRPTERRLRRRTASSVRTLEILLGGNKKGPSGGLPYPLREAMARAVPAPVPPQRWRRHPVERARRCPRADGRWPWFAHFP